MKYKLNIIYLILIICLGISLRVYAGNKKVYFHHDEIFSLEAINDNTWAKERKNENNWNKVISGNTFIVDTKISKEEQFDFIFLKVEGEHGTHPPLHYIGLHTFQTILNNGKISKWPGIILNIFLYIISSIYLYKLSNFFIKDKYLSLIPIFIFSTNTLMISMSIFLRMYEMLTTFSLIVIYFNFKILLNKKDDKKDLIFLGMFCILAGLSHYYFFIIMLMIFIFSMFQLNEKRRIRNYIITLALSGVIYISIWPYFLQHTLTGPHNILHRMRIK